MNKLINLVAKNKEGVKTSLYNHSIQVAEKCLELFDTIFISENTDERNKLRYICYLVGLLHDIGKCSKQFQDYIVKNNEGEYVYHNVLGALLVKHLINVDNNIIDGNELVYGSIKYHHPINELSFKLLSEVNIMDDMFSKVVDEYINIINTNYPFLGGVSKKEINTEFKLEDSAKKIAYYNSNIDSFYNRNLYIVSSILKTADAMVSQELDDINSILTLSNKILPSEIVKPTHYDDRFNTQEDFVNKLISHGDMGLFVSETGFGKTMLGIQYILKSSNRKAYWICPRNTITEGVYNRIVDEIKNLNLQDRVSVGLLLTDTWYHGNENSDIIVTNIDNFLRPVVKSNANFRSYSMLYETVIFDEFHEYVGKDSLMAFFEIVMLARDLLNTKTLLMSATPLELLIPYRIRNNKKIWVESYPDENIRDRKYKIQFLDNAETPQAETKGYMINAITTGVAQEMVLKGLADKTIHSRFFNSDIEEHITDIIQEYGKGNKNGDKKTNWSCTNIISTGVDISFDNCIIKNPVPNRFIQTIGRCNRWSDDKEHKIIIMPLMKDEAQEKFALSKQKLLNISKRMYEELKAYVGDRQEIKFGELYDFNKAFIENPNNKFREYILEMKTCSYEELAKNITYNFTKSFDGEDKVVGNSGFRKTEDSGSKFFCKLKDANGNWIDEIFEGDTMIFNFKDMFRNKRSEKEKFEKRLIKEVANDTNYFKHKSCLNQKTDIIELLIIKGKHYKTPFPIVDYWYYDKNLGLMRKTV